MKFEIITTSKAKHSFLQAGESEYLSRINQIAKIELIEINVPQKISKLKPSELIEEEGLLISKQYKADHVYIGLDETGKELTSSELAKLIQNEFNQGIKALSFIVGGPHGLSKSITTKHRISLSRFTFTSQFARLIILEQIYRGLSIIKNLPYHKE
jgi:23S rRNA (pseudouridine1915-N3)-methyltransferase